MICGRQKSRNYWADMIEKKNWRIGYELGLSFFSKKISTKCSINSSKHFKALWLKNKGVIKLRWWRTNKPQRTIVLVLKGPNWSPLIFKIKDQYIGTNTKLIWECIKLETPAQNSFLPLKTAMNQSLSNLSTPVKTIES